MDRFLLPQKCDIMGMQDTSDRYVTDETEVAVFTGIQCRLDTLMITKLAGNVVGAATVNMYIDGILYIDDDPKFNGIRTWDEKNWFVINGKRYNIIKIHDVWDASSIDHYEVSVQEGIKR